LGKTEKILRINKRNVRISNPDKILMREKAFTKLDFIKYYQLVRHLIIKYAKGRPTSVLRYPEGYPGESFFQRNKPTWAPAWIQSQRLGVKKQAEYILLNNMATIAWLINLESIEFHTAQVKKPQYDRPNMMVFDLDPPLGCSFSELRDFTIAIKPLITSFGYRVFVKTSGKSGIHLYCPIKPKWNFDEVFAASYDIGVIISKRFPESTLKISKKARKSKILIDVYRNHSYQSMALPYGIRATSQANVSMPLRWRDLTNVKSPTEFNIETVPKLIKGKKDPWIDIGLKPVMLHSVSKSN